MAIQVPTNFEVQTNLSLDSRYVAANTTVRDAIPSGQRFEGLMVFVEADGVTYQLVGGIANGNWTPLGGGGSGLTDGTTDGAVIVWDVTTGAWVERTSLLITDAGNVEATGTLTVDGGVITDTVTANTALSPISFYASPENLPNKYGFLFQTESLLTGGDVAVFRNSADVDVLGIGGTISNPKLTMHDDLKFYKASAKTFIFDSGGDTFSVVPLVGAFTADNPLGYMWFINGGAGTTYKLDGNFIAYETTGTVPIDLGTTLAPWDTIHVSNIKSSSFYGQTGALSLTSATADGSVGLPKTAFDFDTNFSIGKTPTSYEYTTLLSFKNLGTEYLGVRLNATDYYPRLEFADSEATPTNFYIGYSTQAGATDYAGMFCDFGDFWLGKQGDGTTYVNYYKGAALSVGEATTNLQSSIDFYVNNVGNGFGINFPNVDLTVKEDAGTNTVIDFNLGAGGTGLRLQDDVSWYFGTDLDHRIYNSAGNVFNFESGAVAGGTWGYIFDTTNALTIGDELVSFRNNGSIKLFIDYEGSIKTDGHAAFGNTTSINPNAVVNAQTSVTVAPTGNQSFYGGDIRMNTAGSTTGQVSVFGCYFYGLLGSAGTGMATSKVYGGSFYGVSNCPVNYESVTGANFSVIAFNAGRPNKAWGATISAPIVLGGARLEQGGIDIYNQSDAGSPVSFGIRIQPQGGATTPYGIALAGDGAGSEIVFGFSQDASIYWDGTDLVIDPTLVSAGTVKIAGNLDMQSNIITDIDQLQSGVATSGAAIAFELDTANDLNTIGDKLLSVKNNAVEKSFIDKDGSIKCYHLGAGVSSPSSTDILKFIETFSGISGDDIRGISAVVNHTGSPALGNTVRAIYAQCGLSENATDNNSNAIGVYSTVQTLASSNYVKAATIETFLHIPGSGAPAIAYGYYGRTATVKAGTASYGVHLANYGASGIPSTSGIYITKQSGSTVNQGITLAGDGIGADVVFGTANQSYIYKDTSDVLTLIGGVADGATAVAHLFNTTNALSTAGAKIASFQTNGVEKIFITKDGELTGALGATTSSAGLDAVVKGGAGGSVAGAGGDAFVIGGTGSSAGVGAGGEAILRGGIYGSAGNPGGDAIVEGGEGASANVGGSVVLKPGIAGTAQSDVKITAQSAATDNVKLLFHELPSSGTDYISLRAPDTLAAAVELILPVDAPANGEALMYSGGAGNQLVWATPPDLGLFIEDASGNIIGGTNAGVNLVAGATYNFFGGHSAGFSATTMDDSVSIGHNSLAYATTASKCIAIGTSALLGNTSFKLTGQHNIGIGYRAGYLIRTASTQNLFMGNYCGDALATGTVKDNILLGFWCLSSATDGDENVIIGSNGANNMTGNCNGNVMVGNNVGPTTVGALSDKLFIHNDRTDTPLIHGDFSTLDVTINGQFSAENLLFNEETAGGTGTAIDWSSSGCYSATPSGATTYTFTAPRAPGWLTLKLTDGSTNNPAWPTEVKWPAATEPTWSTGVDIVQFYFDGTNYHGNLFSSNSS